VSCQPAACSTALMKSGFFL